MKFGRNAGESFGWADGYQGQMLEFGHIATLILVKNITQERQVLSRKLTDRFAKSADELKMLRLYGELV
ncbi:hypothetical protein ACH50O_08045 [Methylomonas sp. 2BW1-5-20]|uniref:hypothetical protein n=1 Tax=Methylomonas sp. 2BW1-5-20 TaxID=3376686 RepID=UPI00404EAED6